MTDQYIAKPVRIAPHPLVVDPPWFAHWRRSERRHYGSGPQAHAELVVLLGLSGRAEYLLDDIVYPLQTGTLLWAFAGQSHVLLTDEAAFDMWVFVVSQRVLPGNEDGLPALQKSQIGAPVEPKSVTRNPLHELTTIAEAVRVAQSEEAQIVGLRWWLSRAWSHWQNAAPGASRAIHPAIAKAAGLVRDNPCLPTDEIAGLVGLSTGRLNRLFRATTGQKLVDFRTEQKLGRVEAAMRLGQRNLLNAAFDAGFGSYSQFYRAFLARTGQNPRRYFQND